MKNYVHHSNQIIQFFLVSTRVTWFSRFQIEQKVQKIWFAVTINNLYL